MKTAVKYKFYYDNPKIVIIDILYYFHFLYYFLGFNDFFNPLA